MVKNNYLLKAKVMHKRVFPKENFFYYNSTYIILPLFNKEVVLNKIFSINKFNLFSFYDKDHGTRKQNSNTLIWALEILKKTGLNQNDVQEIMLLTHPRCLGFVFNPVSFYFCLNKTNNVISIIAEVNNTFGQTHSYVIFEEDFRPIFNNKFYRATKEFFVSPFLSNEGGYEFLFNYSNTSITIIINYYKEGKLMLKTSLVGKRQNLCVKSLVTSVFTTFKTVLLINFQAVKLLMKRLAFKMPPKELSNKITFNKHD